MRIERPLILGACALAVLATGCGVRGKPQPPDTPPELGRGRPTFRRATEELAFPNVPPVDGASEEKADGTGRKEKR